MRQIFSLFTVIILFTNLAFAQQGNHKAVVIKPVYFDVSPPLSEMSKKMVPVDRSWKDGYVINPSNHHHEMKGPEDAYLLDPNIQRAFGLTQTDTTIQNFAGVPSQNLYIPPDTDGDVGLNHYISMVNCRFAVYSKTGSLMLGPLNNSTIWSGMPNNDNDGDPIVLFDEVANRWFISQFSLNWPSGPCFMMVAVSTTADPTGTWNRYQYPFSYIMPDYPKISIWHDGYYLTCNRFQMPNATSSLGVGVYAMDRTKMIAADPNASIQGFTLTSGPWAMLPADCDGPFPADTTPCYFMYTKSNPPRAIVYEFKTNWTAPTSSTFTKVVELPVNAYTYFNGSNTIPQKGTSVKVDAMSGSGRIMFRLAFRKFSDHFSMVANGTVNAGSNIAGIRWYEFRKTAGAQWSVYQQGTYAPDSKYRWMGGIAMDSAGNIALGYSISSADMYPSIRYTGRMAADPLNTMTIAESGIMNGSGSQTDASGRWGDYSAMNVDPDQTTFWYTQEYYTNLSPTNWKTRIASFSFLNALSVQATADPNPICLGGSSQLDVDATGGSGTYTYSWTSNPPGFTSTLKDPTVAPVVSTTYICAVNDGSQTKTGSVLLVVNTTPVVNAGEDALYCWHVPAFPVVGTASDYDSVKWTTPGDGHFLNPGAVATIYYPGSGDHANTFVNLTLTAYPAAPCPDAVSDDVTITFDPCTGIQEQTTDALGITIQPNPGNEKIVISFTGLKSKSTSLIISDLKGQLICQDQLSTPTSTFARSMDVSKYPKGIYMVKVENGKETKTERLIVQ